MIPAVSLGDIQFTITLITIILLVTNELICNDLGTSRLYIKREKFRNITLFFIALFILIFAIKVYVSFMK